MQSQETRPERLSFEAGGDGPETLLLLHGLAGNGAVWDPLLPFVRASWKGRYIVPDLRGHGRSPWAANYSLGLFASDVAQLVRANSRVTVIGHSLGAALAALLASGWFGVDVRFALGLSVKTDWSGEEVAKFRGLGDASLRWFATEQEARDRFLRGSGLTELADRAPRAAEIGVTSGAQGHRVAHDPAIFRSTGDGIDVLMRSARNPVALATGSEDRMASLVALQTFDPDAAAIEGAGHNAHVEQPDVVWRIFLERSEGL